MSKALDVANRRAGLKRILTNEQVERIDQLITQRDEVQIKLDAILVRLYKARVFMRSNKLSKVQQEEFDKLELAKKDYIRQLNNIRMYIDDIQK